MELFFSINVLLVICRVVNGLVSHMGDVYITQANVCFTIQCVANNTIPSALNSIYIARRLLLLWSPLIFLDPSSPRKLGIKPVDLKTIHVGECHGHVSIHPSSHFSHPWTSPCHCHIWSQMEICQGNFCSRIRLVTHCRHRIQEGLNYFFIYLQIFSFENQLSVLLH